MRLLVSFRFEKNTVYPNEQWMMQIARNITVDDWGFLVLN